MAAIVLACGVVPLNAFAVQLWISWNNSRSLACAKLHAEELARELEDYRHREGAYPVRLDVLPSGESLPSFAGSFAYDGAGPSGLQLHEELPTLSGGVRAWSYDTSTGTWTSIRHDS